MSSEQQFRKLLEAGFELPSCVVDLLKRIEELELDKSSWKEEFDIVVRERNAAEAQLEDYYKAWEDMDLTKELKSQLERVRSVRRVSCFEVARDTTDDHSEMWIREDWLQQALENDDGV